MLPHELEPVGTRQYGAYRFSPLLYPQRKLRNKYFLPTKAELPWNDVQFNILGFSWGFGGPVPGLSALDTQNQILQISFPTLVWGVGGFTDDNTGPAASSLGFLFQIFHTHDGNQYRLFNRHISNFELCGIAGRFLIFKRPHLLLPGDSIECEIKNLGMPVAPAVTSAQVLLFTGQVQKVEQPIWPPKQ